MSLSGVFFGAMEFLAMFLLPIILGRLSHFATFRGGRQWYRNLKKPPFTPPGWVFGLAWAIVHPCMGLSSYLILREGGWAAQSLPLALYGIQLLLNATWSPIFFYLRWIDVALIHMLALWGSIAATTIAFYPVNKIAALLLLPHLGWVSFTTVLNFALWALNSIRGSVSSFINLDGGNKDGGNGAGKD